MSRWIFTARLTPGVCACVLRGTDRSPHARVCVCVCSSVLSSCLLISGAHLCVCVIVNVNSTMVKTGRLKEEVRKQGHSKSKEATRGKTKENCNAFMKFHPAIIALTTRSGQHIFCKYFQQLLDLC